MPTDSGVKLTSRERPRLFLAAVLTILFLMLLGLMIAISSGAPDLGLTIKSDGQGHQVVTWLVPNGIAWDQGVRVGDVVVAQNQDNNVRTVIVARDDGLHPASVSMKGDTFIGPLQRWSFILLALIFIGVGGPVYVKARHRVAAGAFYAFCLTSAVSLVVAPAAYLGYGWINVLMFVSLALWSSSFAFFFLNFPVRAGKTRRRHRILVSISHVAGVLTIATFLWIFNFDPMDYRVAQLAALIYMVLCVGLGLASLGRALVKERTTDIRQQMTIVLGGTALAVGPTILLGILPTLVGFQGMRIDVTALTLGIMPLSFAYAITQGQMLGVRNFIRRGVVYVLMGFGVLLAFLLAVSTLGALMPNGLLSNEVGLIGFSLFVFLIAISYGYIQRYVERMVDKYIYHDAYDYKEALLQFSAQLAAEQNLVTLTDELVQRTCRMMNLTCGVLLLAVPPDKDANLQAQLLLNDMRQREGDLDIWGSLRNSQHFTDASGTPGNGSVSENNGSHPGQHGHPHANGAARTDPLLRVVPYARYGDFADWLIDGLHYELSQLGIRLDEADAPMQLIYFNQQASERDEALDTSQLRTQYLRQDAAQADSHARVDAATGNSARFTGPLNGYAMSNGSGGRRDYGRSNAALSAFATGSLRPTRRLDVEGVRSFLGVPLWTRSRFVGVLCLGGKRTGERFTKDDLSLLSTLGSQAALAIYNAQLYEAREQALLDTIGALAHAIEAKDGYTIQHCENMTGRAVALAQAMGLLTKDVENIRMGAILHDVGKIGIPDAVLNKPGKLTSEEYELMKQHAAIGARIVQSVGALQGVVPIVRYHQERYDGSGYPEGLKGEAIPIGARIIGVVDTYGAMTEDRVYRATPGHDKAVAELQRLAGKQFDPQVVATFVELLEERPDLAELPHVRVTA